MGHSSRRNNERPFSWSHVGTSFYERTEVGCRHSILIHFVSCSKWWNQVIFGATLEKNSSPSWSRQSHIRQVFSSWRSLGTYFASTLLYPQSLTEKWINSSFTRGQFPQSLFTGLLMAWNKSMLKAKSTWSGISSLFVITCLLYTYLHPLCVILWKWHSLPSPSYKQR